MNSSTILLLLLGACAFASAGKLWADVCTQSDTKGLPFCDMTKPVDVSSINISFLSQSLNHFTTRVRARCSRTRARAAT